MDRQKTFLISLLFGAFLSVPAAAAAIEINLRIEGPERTIVDSKLSLPESCSVIESSTTTPRIFSGDKAICALEQARLGGLLSTYQVTDWGFGYSLDAIHDVANTPDWSQLWTIRVNGMSAASGIDGVSLAPDDELLLAYGPWPLEPLETHLSTSTAVLDEPISLETYVWSDLNNQFEKLAATSTFWLGSINIETATGTLSWTPAATGTLEVYAEAPGKARSKRRSLVVIEAASSTPIAQATGTPPVHNPANNSAAGGGGTIITHQTIDIAKAVNFLVANQLPDGSIGGDRVISDWSALAFRAAGASANSDVQDALKNFLLADDPGTKTTDYERRAMALMALGVNPFSAGTDYIGKIVSAFDGNQIGDPLYFNDDIFALLPLYAAGYANSDEIMIRAIAKIIEEQKIDGSWGGVDLTAAAVQALAQAKSRPELRQEIELEISEALLKAKTCLKSSQSNTGRIGDNSMSTSWAIQAIEALGESPSDWENNHHNPDDFLASNQSGDGGMEEASQPINIRLWSTAYAITAAAGKTWSGLLASFVRPTPAATDVLPMSASSSESNIYAIATTTEPMATTTPAAVADNTSTSTSATSDQPPTERRADLTPGRVLGAKIAYAAAPVDRQAKAPVILTEEKPTASSVPAEEKKSVIDGSEVTTDGDPAGGFAKYIFFVSGGLALALGLFLAGSRFYKRS